MARLNGGRQNEPRKQHLCRMRDLTMKRRCFAIAAALLAVATALPTTAQERTVRILSGASAGGSSDFATRLLAEALGPILGVRAVVENRTGVNGIVAAQE